MIIPPIPTDFVRNTKMMNTAIHAYKYIDKYIFDKNILKYIFNEISYEKRLLFIIWYNFQ